MAEDSYPQPYPARSGGAVTVTDHQLLAQNWAPAGVIGLTDLVGSNSGSSLQTSLTAGSALLQGIRYVSTATNNLAVPANTSGLTRLDRVVIRLTKTTGVALATIITGTPASSPVLPALLDNTSTFDLPISHYTLVSGGLPTANVDDRVFVGGDCSASVAANVPIDPRIGHLWIQTDTGLTYTWTGTAWSGASFATFLLGGSAPSTVNTYQSVPMALITGTASATNPPTIAANVITVPLAGLYQVSLQARLSAPGATSTSILALFYSGSAVIISRAAIAAGTQETCQTTQTMFLPAGAQLSVQFQVSVTGANVTTGSADSFLSIARIPS